MSYRCLDYTILWANWYFLDGHWTVVLTWLLFYFLQCSWPFLSLPCDLNTVFPPTDLPWTSYIQMNGEHFNVINYLWAGSTEAWNRKWISLIQLLPFQLLFPLSEFPLPKSLFTVLPFPFRIPTSLILSFLSFPLPHSHCGYLYVIIYTKNSYMYLSQN